MPGAGLVRVSVVAGERRADLALPGAIPVAELLPELCRALGTLDAQTAYAGYELRTSEGRALTSDTGLIFQGVEDGSVLTIVSGVDQEPPRVYDDVVEAMADAVESDLRPWDPASGRRTALTTGGAAARAGCAGPGTATSRRRGRVGRRRGRPGARRRGDRAGPGPRRARRRRGAGLGRRRLRRRRRTDRSPGRARARAAHGAGGQRRPRGGAGGPARARRATCLDGAGRGRRGDRSRLQRHPGRLHLRGRSRLRRGTHRRGADRQRAAVGRAGLDGHARRPGALARRPGRRATTDRRRSTSGGTRGSVTRSCWRSPPPSACCSCSSHRSRSASESPEPSSCRSPAAC